MNDFERRVELHGPARGTVIGDPQTVNITFTGASGALAHNARIFQRLIQDRSRNFVGRAFVFDRIDHSVQNRRSGYIVIRGQPGIGKTAIAAALAARRGYACHFNIAHENIRTQQHAAATLGSQLSARYNDGSSLLSDVSGSGLMGELLDRAAHAAEAENGLPVVIVIDALDEAEVTPVGVNRLELPRTLPDGIHVVVTTRDEYDSQLDVDMPTEIHLRHDDPHNREDIAHYVHQTLDAYRAQVERLLVRWRVQPEALASEIVARSEGNFMYVTYVLEDIIAGRLTPLGVDAVTDLPVGLRGYYARHWRQMQVDGAITIVQRSILCLLAVGREPLTLGQLAEYAALPTDDVRATLRNWQAFLTIDRDAGSPRFSLYHRSFADFLREEEELPSFHGMIIDAVTARMPSPPPEE